MLVVGPLMHGNAQWAMWNAFMMAGRRALHSAPLRPRPDPPSDRRRAGGVVGARRDAMARPLAETLAAAAPGTYDVSTLLSSDRARHALGRREG